jgi:phosphatidylglycerol---prolipoprotein diacylglyceryl transferase
MNLLQIHWNISPIIPIGGFEIRWYGLLFALGFFFAYMVLYQVFKKEKVSFKLLDWLTFYFFVAVLVGARLGHVFFYEWSYYKNHLNEILKVWEGGLASHGAAVAILLAMFIYAWKFKVNIWWLLDRIAIVVPLSGACIRFGNLMNSEIYGHVTSLPWGFVFMRDPDAGMLPRHPTQIYEALVYLGIAALLIVLYYRKNASIRPGLLIGIMVVIMFIARFLIEFLKEVQVDFEHGMALNMGQWLSIPFVLLGAYFIWHSMKADKIPQAPIYEKGEKEM